jgi:hypothetical protein
MIIYAIPGLGTNEKLYVNTHIKNHQIVILNWPIPTLNETMESYAKKFLPQIDQTKPFCLLGVSFGGMLCAELSKTTTPFKLFLVSTCKTRMELPWYLKIFKHIPIHKIVGEKYHRKLAYHGKWFIGFGNAYIPEYLGMVNSMTENYFKFCINIIVNWKGKDYGKNIIHIHGTNDRLLKYKYVKSDYTIKGGSHAMIVFNAAEINWIIEKELSNV